MTFPDYKAAEQYIRLLVDDGSELEFTKQVVAAALDGKVLYESTDMENGKVDAAVEFGLLVQVWPPHE